MGVEGVFEPCPPNSSKLLKPPSFVAFLGKSRGLYFRRVGVLTPLSPLGAPLMGEPIKLASSSHVITSFFMDTCIVTSRGLSETGDVGLGLVFQNTIFVSKEGSRMRA